MNNRVYLWRLVRIKQKKLSLKSGSTQKQVVLEVVDALSLGFSKIQLDESLRRLV